MRIHRRTWLAFLFLAVCFCHPVYALDTDRDVLDDDKEAAWGTDINNPDSDGDGFLDGEEVDSGTIPMDATSYPDLAGTGEQTLFTPAFSVLNNAAPATRGVEQTLFSPAFSVLNNGTPATRGVEQTLFSPAFSVLNNAAPMYSGVEYSVYTPTFSIFNDITHHSTTYVSITTGNDTSGDGSRTNPWASIQKAIDSITDANAYYRYAVLIAAGTYTSTAYPVVAMKPYVDLFGGYDPTKWTRHGEAGLSIVDGADEKRCVTMASHACLDGFYLCGGKAASGAAVVCESVVDATLSNNVISGNTAVENGGAVYCSDSSPLLINNTIVGNSAGLDGGGIYCNVSSPTITNCIFWNTGDEVVVWGDSHPVISYSNVEEGAYGTANIDGDPLFVAFTSGDFHLQETSPSVKKGIGPSLDASVPLTDIDGDERKGEVCDIGADEVIGTQGPTDTFTPIPKPTDTWTPIPKPTDTFTPIPKPTDTWTPIPKPTDTWTPIPKPTDTWTPIPKPTDTFTPIPKPTDTFTPIPKPTDTWTPVPPTPTWTDTPTSDDTIVINLPNLATGARPLRLVRIPAGTFMMGGDESDPSHYADEGPIHQVTIGSEFFIGETEVTQAQWKAVMGYNPDLDLVYELFSKSAEKASGIMFVEPHISNMENEGNKINKGDRICNDGVDYPVYYVTWYECQTFIRGLELLAEKNFRLPIEAEWEYACRAGTNTRFYFGDSLSCNENCQDCAAGAYPGNRSNYLWYCGSSTNMVRPVAEKIPNGFGLYDMHGGLWEWCEDWYQSDFYSTTDSIDVSPFSRYSKPEVKKITRSGGYFNEFHYCRSSERERNNPRGDGSGIGFRVVMVIGDDPTLYPATPTGLAATGTAYSILLTWTPNSSTDVKGYNIYRDTTLDGSFGTLLNNTPLKTCSFVDKTATAGVTYYYKVTAVSNGALESDKSSSVSATAGLIILTMPDVRGIQGSTVTLQINASNATGISGYGMDLQISYDPSLLTLKNVYRTTLTREMEFMTNLSVASGQLNITATTLSGVSMVGEGRIFDIIFQVSSSATNGATSQFSFTSVTMYNSTPTLLNVDYTDTSQFLVEATYILGDVDGNSTVNYADVTLARQIAVGTVTPTTLQLLAGDMNGDGKINSADVILILRKYLGYLPGLRDPIKKSSLTSVLKTTSYTIEIGSAVAAASETVEIPVSLNTMAGVAGVDLTINFDPSVLTLENVAMTPLIDSTFLLDYALNDNSLNIVLASAEAGVESGGEILKLTFKVVGLSEQETPLLPVAYTLSGEYGEDLSWQNTVEAIAGEFSVEKASWVDWFLYR